MIKKRRCPFFMINGFKRILFLTKTFCLKRGSYAFASELSKYKNMSRDELLEHNMHLRKEIVVDAFKNCPYYHRKYKEAGFEAADVNQDDFFEKLPILEKTEIRSYPEEIVRLGFSLKKLNVAETGGSTGEPLKVYHDPQYPLDLISWRTLRWWGVDISSNSGYLYRAVPSRKHQRFHRLLLWPTQRSWLAAIDMTLENMRHFYEQVKYAKTQYLVGYVGALDIFASYLEKNNIRLPELSAVWTTSSPLTEGKRKFMESIFGCPVYTQYGSCEFYWISAECLYKQGLHIASDIRHVEIVEGKQNCLKDVFGDIIVTDLVERKFPLIRYRIGDRGRLLSRNCTCGLPFPLMDYVKGRVSDAIMTKSGNLIPGEYWTTIFDDYTDEIKSFQIHQSRDLDITVRYEPNRNIDYSGLISKVRTKLLNKLGTETVIRFVQTQVDVNDNGKTRFVVSEVSKK